MFKANSAVLVVIDVQGKLASLMFERERTVKNIQGMIQIAQILDIPILWTEQVPEKIGSTSEEITAYLHYLKPISKNTFSCCGEEKFMRVLEKLKRKQVIIAGIEAHVCVHQTVADLLERKYAVEVVADAVSSRTEANRSFGLERMKQLGAGLTCTEMIACELLEKAEGVKFKEVLKLIK